MYVAVAMVYRKGNQPFFLLIKFVPLHFRWYTCELQGLKNYFTSRKYRATKNPLSFKLLQGGDLSFSIIYFNEAITVNKKKIWFIGACCIGLSIFETIFLFIYFLFGRMK